MDMFDIIVIVEILILPLLAVLIIRLVNKEQREKFCLYCCCREHCRIGYMVEQKCSDEELRPFPCKK